jgi:hypothetical protein
MIKLGENFNFLFEFLKVLANLFLLHSFDSNFEIAIDIVMSQKYFPEIS